MAPMESRMMTMQEAPLGEEAMSTGDNPGLDAVAPCALRPNHDAQEGRLTMATSVEMLTERPAWKALRRYAEKNAERAFVEALRRRLGAGRALHRGGRGRLPRLLEHSVFTQGAIWAIDSFDQGGVESSGTRSRGGSPPS